MTLLVRDEEDILAANIDFHLACGVDFFLVFDNISMDRTAEILRGYEERGLLEYRMQPDDTFAQAVWVTEMARRAAIEFGADWVINADADEFWCPVHGTLKDALATLAPEHLAAKAERSNFVPRPRLPGSIFADVMTVREVRSLDLAGTPLPSKICHRGLADIEVAQGNHAVKRADAKLPAQPAQIEILHFPVRSYQQLANKIAKGGAAYERNTSLPAGTGWTWRVLYERLKRGELEDYYRSLELDEAGIEAGLCTGRLVEDRRLQDFFADAGTFKPRFDAACHRR